MDSIKLEKKPVDVSPRQTLDYQEPKVLDKSKLECPVCNRTFSSRQDYDSHWLACHQDIAFSLASGSMGSMLSNGEGHCEEAATKQR